MMIFLKRFLITVFILFASLLILQVVNIFIRVGKISYDKKAFVQIKPEAKLKILILGDSTALGTGANDGRESVSGWFAQDFPDAHIENHSKNGRKIAGLIENFPQTQIAHYNLIVIQIGGNDILKFTSFYKIETGIKKLIDIAKPLADEIILLHSGNVGSSPVFNWPFNDIFTERTKRVRSIYKRIALEKNIYYVDLFQERKDDLFNKDIPKYYSADYLHPSGEGYRWWYESIRRTLERANVKLN